MNYSKKTPLLLLFLLLIADMFSQSKKEELEEIIITSSRIEIPYSKNSKNILVINSQDIENGTATNLTELLQSIEGIDIIQRGVHGAQSDIKIRGGNFQQVLLLIDGFKTEDSQTGHHIMNMMIPLENIERIEIIKGSSARVFGQNAFTGAINIVTKKIKKDKLTLSIDKGSFAYLKAQVTASKVFKKSNHQVHFSQQKSEGHRFNADFENTNYFLKSNFETKKEPIKVLASFADRKFGAQYFYTSPASGYTEYEETQSSLVGISTKYVFSAFSVKPKLYWKRNQDMFLLKRENPSFSRNHNISNKIGVEINTSYKSKIGITGVGIDVAKVSLASNNLGDQERGMITLFAEHRYTTKNEIFDFTPGIAVSYYSDFGTHAFPGLDVGYKATAKTRLFYNVGTSYRVPTYTEMYINIPNFLSGYKNLKPEKAFSQEIGLKYKNKQVSFNSSVFYRVSNDLIDYVKETENYATFQAQNLRTIITKGFEINGDMNFSFLSFGQKLHFGYTFLEDDYKDVNVFKSRYILNSSMKHHFTTSLQTQFIKNVKQTISYRYVEKLLNKYTVLDMKVSADIQRFSLFVVANNILDTEYFEKKDILMPKSNYQIGVKFRID